MAIDTKRMFKETGISEWEIKATMEEIPRTIGEGGKEVLHGLSFLSYVKGGIATRFHLPEKDEVLARLRSSQPESVERRYLIFGIAQRFYTIT